MLNINFWNGQATKEEKEIFMQAVAHENSEMNIQLCDETLARLNSRLNKAKGEKSTATEEEIEALQSQIESTEALKKEFQADSESTLEVYEKVISEMTVKSDAHFGNNKDVVRIVLRVLASVKNSKLVKFAIIPAFENAELYEALETIHVNSSASEDGAIIMSKEVKEAYKKASNELESIIKNTFSLPFETPYTSKTRVKMTAEDKKLLNDCYIKGFSNKFETDDETGTVSFKKRQVNRLVRKRQDKKTGKTTYDYSGLATTIANIVVKHYFA